LIESKRQLKCDADFCRGKELAINIKGNNKHKLTKSRTY